MKACPACASENADDACFCSSCGAPLALAVFYELRSVRELEQARSLLDRVS